MNCSESDKPKYPQVPPSTHKSIKRGYSEATIEDIAGKNLLRYFAML